MDWPKGPTSWTEGRTLFVSIPFTWDLLRMRSHLERPNLLWDRAVVGGPAVRLMPGFFADLSHVEEGREAPGVLQRINSMATRTTTGCPNRCGFCGVKRIEPVFEELEDWPVLPVLCDNNLFAASSRHFDRVMDRLEAAGWDWVDFNQGVDARRLDAYHAARIARFKKPVVRLALDSMDYAGEWEAALGRLLRAGVRLKSIKSYALIGFKAGIEEAWCRCRWIEDHGVQALPMFYRPLDAMDRAALTPAQIALGWSDEERARILRWFYFHLDRDKWNAKKRAA